jgi:hypothetical protein
MNRTASYYTAFWANVLSCSLFFFVLHCYVETTQRNQKPTAVNNLQNTPTYSPKLQSRNKRNNSSSFHLNPPNHLNRSTISPPTNQPTNHAIPFPLPNKPPPIQHQRPKTPQQDPARYTRKGKSFQGAADQRVGGAGEEGEEKEGGV